MSDNKVVALGRTHSIPEPDSNIVEHLENLLEEARRGEVRALLVAYVDPASEITTIISQGSAHVAFILGAAALLQHKVAKLWTSDE